MVLTLVQQEELPGSAVLPLARVHRGVAVLGSPLRPELSI